MRDELKLKKITTRLVCRGDLLVDRFSGRMEMASGFVGRSADGLLSYYVYRSTMPSKEIVYELVTEGRGQPYDLQVFSDGSSRCVEEQESDVADIERALHATYRKKKPQ